MTVLPVVIAPDPVLKQKSASVEKVDDAVRQTLNDMLDTMYSLGGIGLAAVQVGILKRLIVVDVGWTEKDDTSRKALKLVNAELIANSQDEGPYNEGCLSFPDQYSDVIRPKEVTVRYTDENGQQQELQASGLLATCIQHEIDHTNGITFVDHISRLKRDMIVKKLQKAKERGDFDHGHHDHDHVHGEHCNH